MITLEAKEQPTKVYYLCYFYFPLIFIIVLMSKNPNIWGKEMKKKQTMIAVKNQWDVKE